MEATAHGRAKVFQADRDIVIRTINIRAGKSVPLVAALLVAVPLAVLVLSFVPVGQVLGSRGGVTWLVVGMGASAAASLPLRREWQRLRRARLSTSPELRQRLAEQMEAAAENLAHEVRRECEREEAVRRLSHPQPLAVRWLTAEAFSDHWASIRAGESDEPLDLAGVSRDVAALYSRVPSGRLLMLGPAGSGKSVLALRLALECLTLRQPGAPVPVTAIGHHLLDQLLPALYADRPEEALRHLSYLAARLESRGEQDLAWWRLGWVSRVVGRAVGALIASAVVVGAVRYLFGSAQVDLVEGTALPVWLVCAVLGLAGALGLVVSFPELPCTPRFFSRPKSFVRLLLTVILPIGGLLMLAGAAMGVPALVVPCSLPVAGLTLANLFPRLPEAAASSPREAFRSDRRVTMVSLGLANIARFNTPVLLAAGVCALPVAMLLTWRDSGGRDVVGAGDWAVAVGASALALVVLGASLSAWSAAVASRVWPWLTGRLPWDVPGLLDDAHRRGILRQAGMVYRFRHLTLQQRLAAQAAHVPFHRVPSAAAGRIRLLARKAAAALLTGTTLLGGVAMCTVTAALPGAPGPRLSVPPACELLSPVEFQNVLSASLHQGDSVTPAGRPCMWLQDRDRELRWQSAFLQVEGYGPRGGKSAVQAAEWHFSAATDQDYQTSRMTRRVVGLGNEAITTVAERNPAVTVVARVDNLILTLELIPEPTDAFTTDDEVQRSAGAAERLLYLALERLGPPGTPAAG
ncbi:hypothetical protein OG535_04005 [Kitasatospora sp. NBC_00085]|uniref:hypothetical protein n=1 Tax=unclassified Kitasatospora TaxID=2633591 RepID=UPI0032518797